MAKELGRFEIRVTGTKADGPQSMRVIYQCQDDTDPELVAPAKIKDEVDLGDMVKKLHDAGAAGELWTDMIGEVEATEGIE